MILVKTFYAYNELRNYSYLILDNESGDSWVIDPYEASPIIDYIKKNGIKLKGILNTHQHFDHIRGNAPLIDAFHSPVQKLKNSSSITLTSGHSLESLDTPGHTMDHQVFIWKQEDQPLALFSGDTLFNSGVGNCRSGDPNTLYQTTEKLLKTLPDSTLLYPGHDYRKRNLEFAHEMEPENWVVKESLSSIKGERTEELSPVTLGDEKKVNPFLRLNSEELKHNLLKNSSPLSDEKENERQLFLTLRKLRDQW
ncbi:MAG: hydroxyacylglutathione hydrolase [Bacteriovoracia bacterium]